MILTKSEILKEMEAGNIVIKDFNINNLGPNSYDMTLYSKLKIYTGKVLDPKKQNDTFEFDIPEEGKTLQPGQIYLARVNEWTNSVKTVPVAHGKSSLGRLGLSAHICAGLGDTGWSGYMVLELMVVKPLIVYPGMKVCQMVWHVVQGDITTYSGKYVDQSQIEASKSFEDANKNNL